MTFDSDRRRDELIARLSSLSTENLELIMRLVERRAASRHDCDRNGPAEKFVDDSFDPPIAGIFPTCSGCGKPQVFPPTAQ